MLTTEESKSNSDISSYNKGENIQDIDSEDNSSTFEESINTFDELDLKENLLRGIYGYGFEKPSPIQQRAIKPTLTGRDVIAQAQSGTGKTATFAISALQIIDRNFLQCQSIILAPTRDLAQQIHEVVSAIGINMGLKILACVGGTTENLDLKALREGVHIVIGTPGRIISMITKQALRTESVKLFVLDEADVMLGRGFKDQIYEIFQHMPEDVQSLIVSATIPPEVLEVSRRFMRDPLKILVKKEALTLQGIRQFYIAMAREEWKFNVLCDLYGTLSITQSIIFCNTRRRVEWLAEKMRSNDYTVSAIHGDLEQRDRESILRQFRSGSSRVLISTDILARGIDVQQVSLVINYDLPLDIENYLHRIGRSGRHGRKGVSINFVTRNDMQTMRDIETYYSTQVKEMPENIADLI
eukprot:gene32855-42535_t